HLFSATVSHLDYAAVVFVYFLDFETKWFHEQTVLAPLGAGVQMPETVTGDIDFRSSGLAVRMNDDGRQIQLAVDSRNFGGRPLRADLPCAARMGTRPSTSSFLGPTTRFSLRPSSRRCPRRASWSWAPSASALRVWTTA